MNPAVNLFGESVMTDNIVDARQIPALDHDEAADMAAVELDRFLSVVESLSGDDWEQPTDCTEWSVRDILAHQAGSHAGGANLREFLHQGAARPAPGQMQVDAINARQLADRAGRSPAELIGELRRVGPRAVRNRHRLPWLLRKLPVPFGPPLGTVPVEYLTDLIYARDTWMHRADICRATGRPFLQTDTHDGRLVALIVRDLALALEGKLAGQSLIFDLMGAGGGRYRLGQTAEPSAIVKMDVVEFARLASGRTTAEAVLAAPTLTISGDRAFAARILELTAVPF